MKETKTIETVDISTPETLASEMYRELKEANQYKNTIIKILCGIIALLIIAMAALHGYHIHQWSQYETVVVDSADGGNANYVGGENTGGIYNGEGYSAPQEEGNTQGERGSD